MSLGIDKKGSTKHDEQSVRICDRNFLNERKRYLIFLFTSFLLHIGQTAWTSILKFHFPPSFLLVSRNSEKNPIHKVGVFYVRKTSLINAYYAHTYQFSLLSCLRTHCTFSSRSTLSRPALNFTSSLIGTAHCPRGAFPSLVTQSFL